jgi:hypothetical protein
MRRAWSTCSQSALLALMGIDALPADLDLRPIGRALL